MTATVLHLVTRSPFDGPALEDALRCSSQNDAIVLMHDGVLAAPASVPLPQALAARFTMRHLYVLAPDLAARGMGGTRLRKGIQPLDDFGFVALAAAHPTSLTWA